MTEFEAEIARLHGVMTSAEICGWPETARRMREVLNRRLEDEKRLEQERDLLAIGQAVVRGSAA